jgi:hypothetical protein
MAFPAYDGFSRSVSRRQSLGYPTTPMSYSPQGMYTDPTMVHRSLGEVSDFLCVGFDMLSYMQQYPQPSYSIYGPPATVPVSHRLTGPCRCCRIFSILPFDITL